MAKTKAPPVLLPYQRRWVADPAPVKVASKGRRIGLTWAEASDGTLIAAARKPKGDNVHYIGTAKKMAKEYIDACAHWARAFGRAASEVGEELFEDSPDGEETRQILMYVIRFSSGCRIEALSSEPRTLRGMDGVLVADEAAFMRSLNEVVKAGTPFLTWGGKLRIISTHNGQSEFLDYERSIQSGQRDWSLHRITLDDAIRDGLYRRICEKRGMQWSPEAEAAWRRMLIDSAPDKESADEEYFCIPKSGAGVYLSRALLEDRSVQCPARRLARTDADNLRPEPARLKELEGWCKRELGPTLDALDPRREHAAGMDFGRSADLSVLQVLQIETSLERRPALQLEMKNVPFAEQDLIVKFVCDRLPRMRKIAVDARGNGQALAEACTVKYGARAEAVMISAGFYSEHMPRMRSALEAEELSIPKDADTLDDYLAIRVVNGVPKIPDTRTGAAADRHGDAAIAGCLAYYASRADVPEYGGKVAPRPRAGDAGTRGMAGRGMAMHSKDLRARDIPSLSRAGGGHWL